MPYCNYIKDIRMHSLPSKPHGKSRPSQSQPYGRCADWAKNERSYRRTIENPPIRPINREDYGEDNFAYDSTHLPDSGFPSDSDLLQRLPPKVAEQANPFIQAYAAVNTAFDRIEALGNEAPDRVDPKTTHTHLISRRVSDQTPTVVGAETPPSLSTPEAQKLSMPVPYTPARIKKSLMQMVPQLPVNMMGLESPPFTPVDSKVANTPVNEPLLGPESMETDLARVSAELSKNALTIESPGMPVKNEIAWRTYVNQYNAEIDDIKHTAFKRLEGYDRLITRELFEHLHDDSMSKSQRIALQDFRDWWLEALKEVSKLETKVMALEEKVVGTRTELRAIDMKAAAWPS